MKLTSESLAAVLQKGEAQACVALFRKAAEKERQAVADLALRWLKEQSATAFIETRPGTFTRNPRLSAAEAAVFAACSLAQLRKLGWRGVPDHELAYRVLVERRPEWLDDWAKMALEIHPRHWPLVRRLVREGLCRRPVTDNYWLGMLDAHVVGLGRNGRVRDGLLADPGLLDEVWRLFEIEGGGEFSLAARDKYSRPEGTWQTGLVELAAEGKLSRARLLDASLDALARDFAQFRAGWFSRFHEALKPTVEERAARAERYLQLLASKTPPTVSFALGTLDVLDRAGKLPGRTVVEHIGPALFARHKGTVLAALKLLDRVATTEPDLRGTAARVAAQALGHESAEVQGAYLDLIERHADRRDAELAAAIHARADALAASQKPRLAAWLGAREEKPEGSAAPADLRALRQRVRKLAPKWRKLAGVDQVLRCLEDGGAAIQALDFNGTEIPRLRPDGDITPIADLDELIDRFAAVLEDPGAPDEVERVLDGVSRLCNERPEDFARRTGPLARRAAALLKRCWFGPFAGGGPGPDLCGLALAWSGGTMPGAPEGGRAERRQRTVLHFLSLRVRAVARRVCEQKARPLLAAPTHSGCWIDARELVKRATSAEVWDGAPDLPDQVQSLLRLAPEHRAAVLRKAGGVPGEYGAALRHALGAAAVEVGPTAALWVAAARTRQPLADDSAVDAVHPNLGPNASRAGRVSFRVEKLKQWHRFYLDLEPPAPKTVPWELPTVLLLSAIRKGSLDSGVAHCDAPAVRWAGSVWPSARESWCAAGALLLGRNLDWWEAEWGNRAYLEALLDPDVPLRPMALVLLVLGLAAKEPGESGLATDALIAAVDDGRLDGPRLGSALAGLFPTGLVKPGRWARTLREGSRLSALHASVVADAIQHALAGDAGQAPRDLHELLEVLHELLVERETGLSVASCRAYLEGIKAAGKTGKLVRAILARGDSAAVRDDEPAKRALAGRLERAERWAGHSCPAG